MLWWWKLQLESPDGPTRQQAIDELAASLASPGADRQRKAAGLLATIGHPLAVRWSLQHVAQRELAEWNVRQLDAIMNRFADGVETESLQQIAALHDPLQKIPPAQIAPGEKRIPATWETYRAIDCSGLRQKAEAELKRRAEAEAEWRKADEALKEKRQSTLVLIKRRAS